MEPGTGLALLGTLVGGSKVIEKLLGPTADYLGKEMKNWVEKRLQNVARIFKQANNILGDEAEQPGQVPARVLKGILEEGAYCEDELTSQYFGGVLASSRSGISRDDRGATFISTISRLSTYQIRSHYLFYAVYKSLCHGKIDNLGDQAERLKYKIFIPEPVFVVAMDLQENEDTRLIASHTIFGLSREDLIGSTWLIGNKEMMKKEIGIDVGSNGVMVYPTLIGMELYLWAHGFGNIPANSFLTEEFKPMALEGINIPDGPRCIER